MNNYGSILLNFWSIKTLFAFPNKLNSCIWEGVLPTYFQFYENQSCDQCCDFVCLRESRNKMMFKIFHLCNYYLKAFSHALIKGKDQSHMSKSLRIIRKCDVLTKGESVTLSNDMLFQ